jgi:hypothetical protein
MNMKTMAAAMLIVAGAQPASRALAAVDPCALLTKQEAATALGEAVGEPKKIERAGSAGPGSIVASCEYTSAARHSVNLIVRRFSSDSEAVSVQVYKAAAAKKEGVPGIGDLACWNDSSHRELQVLKGATVLTIQINRDGNATGALTIVAKNAAARLVNP